MQLIKPERKIIFPKKCYTETDIKIHFHYSKREKSNTVKRFFFLSIVHFLRKNELSWKRASFAIENGMIIFTEGQKKDTFYISRIGYIYNINLVMKICEIYNIQIPENNAEISFKCKQIRKNIWQLITQ